LSRKKTRVTKTPFAGIKEREGESGTTTLIRVKIIIPDKECGGHKGETEEGATSHRVATRIRAGCWEWRK